MGDNGRSCQDRLIDALLDLTRRGDVLSLNGELQGCLLQLVPGAEIRVYERSGPGGGWRLSQVGVDVAGGRAMRSRVPRAVKDADTEKLWGLRAQEDRIHLQRHGREIVAVFPIRRGLDLVAGSVVQGECGEQELEYLRVLMEAYTNLYRTLYKGSHDTLTGLLNRTTFDERIRALVEDATVQHLDFAMLGENRFFAIIDIDHFKRINDTFGHLYGDEVLLMFAQVMGKCFRDGDLLFRFGGEEFIVILNDLDAKLACDVLERFRLKLEGTVFPQVGQVTCSIGFTHLDISKSTDAIADRADKALYYAKQNGRNQVRYFESLFASGELIEEARDAEVDLF